MSADSRTPARGGSTSSTGGERSACTPTRVSRVQALWRRVVASVVVGDPDPRYSALDRWDGLRVTGADRSVHPVLAPVDGRSSRCP